MIKVITEKDNVVEATVVKPEDEFVCPYCKDGDTLDGGGDGRCTCSKCYAEFQFSTKNGKLYREVISEDNKRSTNDDLVKYNLSAMDSFPVIGLPKLYPNNVRSNQVGNYNTYKIIGTAKEVQPILDYCKTKGVKPKKSVVNNIDRKWYNSKK